MFARVLRGVVGVWVCLECCNERAAVACCCQRRVGLKTEATTRGQQRLGVCEWERFPYARSVVSGGHVGRQGRAVGKDPKENAERTVTRNFPMCLSRQQQVGGEDAERQR